MPYDVVSFGETMLRFSPLSGARLADAHTFQAYVAGSESNLLTCLARLGLRCAWISALPTNPMGYNVASEIRRHGVDTCGVVWGDESGRVGVYYAEELAAPLGVQAYYDRANSMCALVDPDLIDLSILQHTRMLHLTGITPGLSGGAREVFRRLLHRAEELSIPLSFDVNYRSKMWGVNEARDAIEEACQVAHILFCTRDDAALLWGFRGEPRTVLQCMWDRFGGTAIDQTIVLTLGKDGAMQLSDAGFTQAPAFPSAGTMRLGSGDAFAAGYLAAYLKSPALSELIEENEAGPLVLGNVVAALKRCIAGDIALVTPDDLTRLLRVSEGVRFR